MILRKKSGLMTEGNIFEKILLFSIPLLLGNFFQLMYNAIDSFVVGNFVGKHALAAVGTSTPIINLMIAFFQGLATGAGVIVSKYYGARDKENVSKAVHTFVMFSLLLGIFLSVFGYLISPKLLEMMNTPSDSFDSANAYLKTYFLGNVFVTLYNAGTGILQSVGNAKAPLFILIVSSIINVFLDLLFVRVIKLGVVGAALATIICQAFAMVLVLYILCKNKSEYQLIFKKLKIHLSILKEIVFVGVPAGLQGMVVSVSNVMVMYYINGFGSAAVAGFSSANKFDNFLGLPVNSFMLAITTFVSQNLGAKKYDRVKQGIRATLIMSLATVIVLGVIVMTFADSCIGIFNSDKDVIEAGATFIRIMCPFYFALCFHQVYSGALRASGRSFVPMFTSIMAFVVIRQIYLAIVLKTTRDISMIGWGYSLTWILAAVFTGCYYHFSGWLQKEMAK